MRLLLPFAFSFVLTLIGVFFCLRIFPKLSLMDRPHEYGLSRKPVPYSGGIIFFFVFLIGTFLFVEMSKPIVGLIFGGLLITFVSFMDDRVKLGPWFRLGVQILAGIIIVLAGVKMQLIKNPFGESPIFLDTVSFHLLGQEIWLFSGIAIIIWLILMMNVTNWLDGIPGLASGVSTIAQISLFILSSRQFHIVDQGAVITISSMLAASTLIFLFFDFPRGAHGAPRVLMGDTGSMFLGFMLGSLSIIAGGKLATALLIMGFPVLDAFWVILKRLFSGKSLLQGDLTHFHHRLLRAGLSERASLFLNYAFCATFAAIALYLTNTRDKFFAFLGVFGLMILIGVIINARQSKA